jgi:hypothetical protein
LCLTNEALYHEDIKRRGCIAMFLDLGTSWKFTPQQLYSAKKSLVSFDTRLGGLQSWSGQHEEVNILDPTDALITQPVASCYTDSPTF